MDRRLKFHFDREKAIEIVLYIAKRISKPDLHNICKILYFADRKSLEQYGRFLCGDTYYAMQYGAVPSGIYRLLKDAKNPQEDNANFGVQNRKDIIPFRDADITKLSQSDRNCLDEIIQKHGESSFNKLTLDSHDDAWFEAWQERGDSKRSLMTIEIIVQTLESGNDLLEFLLNRHND